MSERWCNDCSWPYECAAAYACHRAEKGERRVAATAETADAIEAYLAAIGIDPDGAGGKLVASVWEGPWWGVDLAEGGSFSGPLSVAQARSWFVGAGQK